MSTCSSGVSSDTAMGQPSAPTGTRPSASRTATDEAVPNVESASVGPTISISSAAERISAGKVVTCTAAGASGSGSACAGASGAGFAQLHSSASTSIAASTIESFFITPPFEWIRNPSMHPDSGSFRAVLRHFPLKYTKYSCGKMACPARKSLAAGHISSFYIHPGKTRIAIPASPS